MIGDVENDDAAADKEADTRRASQKEDDGFLLDAKGWWKLDREHSVEWRKDATEDYDFVAGKQWSEEDRKTLKEQSRPEITFNRIAPTAEAVLGLEIGNRREVQYIPRTEGDAKADEILTAAAEWCRDECDAEDEETDAFWDTIVCGMGWIDTRMEYEEDPDGKVVEERIDPLEMYWDNSARKRNLADARRLWRVRTMPLADAKALIDKADDFEDSDFDASWARAEEKKDPHNADPMWAYKQGDQNNSDTPPAEVTIVHVQWWEREPYYRVAFNGRIEEVSEKDFGTLKERADKLAKAGLAQPMQSVRQTRKVFKQAIIGAKVLSRGDGACKGHFTWECVTGKRDHNAGTWYGLVRAMKDPQRWANKWLSQGLHILNTNAKGGLFAERGAFDNDLDAEDSYARSDRFTWVKPGKLASPNGAAIQPKPQPTFPAGFDNLMQFAISSIRDVSGVNLELLGLRDANQAGVLEEHRKQAGMTILASLFDSLRRFRKRQGRVLLYYIMTYLSDGRLVRIVGDEGAKYVPLIRQPGVAQYDVIVDDAPTSPNQKEKVWDTIMQLMPALGPVLTPDDWLALAKFSPLPTSVVEDLIAQRQKKAESEAPMQEQIKQLSVALQGAEVQLKNAQANQANANAAKAQSDAAANDPGMQAQQKQDELAANMTVQREKMAGDMQVQREKNFMDAHAKVQSAAITAALRPKPEPTQMRK